MLLLLLLADYCRSDTDDDDGDDGTASIHGHATPLLECQLLEGCQASHYALALTLTHPRTAGPTVARR